MTSRNLKDVVIINAVALNGGDAAILDAVSESVCKALNKRPEQIEVLDRNADVAKNYLVDTSFYYPGFELCRARSRGALGKLLTLGSMAGLALKAVSWKVFGTRAKPSPSPQDRYLSIIAQSEAVVSTGGTMFVERYNIFPKVYEVLIAWIFGKPVYLYTQSFEPYRKFHNRLMMKAMLRYAKVVMVRGEASADAVRDLGIAASKIHVLPDVVFRFRRETVSPTVSDTVSISVRSWQFVSQGKANQYRQAIAGLVEHLVLKMNRKVRFISTCQGIPEYTINDSEEAAQIAALVSPAARAQVTVDADYHSRAELMDIFAQSELVVGTRLHACIMALCARTGVIPIAYEDKTYEVFQRIDPTASVLGYDNVTAAALIDQVEAALADRAAFLARQENGVLTEYTDSMRADALVAAHHGR